MKDTKSNGQMYSSGKDNKPTINMNNLNNIRSNIRNLHHDAN